MKKIWKTPGGQVPAICLNMLNQPHLLIAGSTGSGKSVLINSLIYTALHRSPATVKFILIDPKRVELNSYAELPHVIRYASEPYPIAESLTAAVNLMEERFNIMQKERLKEYDGSHIYVIIDEFADLMTTQKKNRHYHYCNALHS